MKIVEANGMKMPALGFGTWQLKGADAERMVAAALDIGYRHIDTAQIYGNEGEVGAAIAGSGVARGDLFVTTKVWMDRMAPGDLEKSVDESLERLKLDHVDLLLIHWPVEDVPLADSLGALGTVRGDGRAKNIGVSNFPSKTIRQAADLADYPLTADQVEYHPFLDQTAVLDTCREEGMALTAYSPIAQGKVFDDETIGRIGEKHGKNAAQVTLRWLIDQQNVAAIPRSSSEDHARSNFDIFDFELSPAEREDISALARPDGRMIDPDWAPDWD